jgi:hypothetical protein
MNTVAGQPVHARLLLLVALSACLLAIPGCRSEHCLDMSIESGVMQRLETDCSAEDPPPDPDVLGPGRIPEGLGENGWFLHQDTALGSHNVYVEQFDWFTDPSASLDFRRFAARRLVDVWVAWLDSELSGDPAYPAFREFVDSEIRADIDDLFLIVWGYAGFGPSLTKFDDESDATLFGEMAVRGLTYLAWRGYFELGEVHDVIAAFGQSTNYDDDQSMADFWLRAVARRMGAADDARLPYPLNVLQEQPHRYAGSYAYFMSESLAVRDLVLQWERDYPDYVMARQPEPVAEAGEQPPADTIVVPTDSDVIEEVIVPVGPFDPIDTPDPIRFDFQEQPFERIDGTLLMYASSGDVEWFGRTTGLKARVKIPTEPLWTNAHVIDGNSLEWRETIHGMTFYSNLMSTILYAAWAEPDADYQREHFGKVVLEGEDLADYVMWHMQLKREHAGEWDGLIESLSPDDTNLETLELFRFSDEPSSVIEFVPELNADQEIVGEVVINRSVAADGASIIIRSLKQGDDQVVN